MTKLQTTDQTKIDRLVIAFGFGPGFFFVSCSCMNSAIAGVSLRFLPVSRLANPSWSVGGVLKFKIARFSKSCNLSLPSSRCVDGSG
jgi:hypothetical protein